MSTDQVLHIPPPVPPQFLQDHSPGFDSAVALQLLAALRLNSTTSGNQPTTMPPCTKCSSSNKRHSPSSLSPQQPSSKRAALHQPSSSTKSSGDQLLHGFTKIPLPLPSPVLGRTLSAPIPSSQTTNNLNHQSSNGAPADTHLPEESSGVNSAPAATSSQQPLYRSFSEPIPDSYRVVATSTPPRPPPDGKLTRLPPSAGEASGFLSRKQESPDAKRLKRMKERLREMSKWWDEVIKEGEEDAGSENNDLCLPKDDSDASQESDTEAACQEAVWVERKGELLILHFKCPCGKGYQILLSGNSCYYKLTSF